MNGPGSGQLRQGSFQNMNSESDRVIGVTCGVLCVYMCVLSHRDHWAHREEPPGEVWTLKAHTG